MAYTVPFLINNEEITSSKTFDVKSPLDHSLLWKSSAATVQDIEAAIESASDAFRLWSTTKLVKRRELIYKLVDVLGRRRQELMDNMANETAALGDWVDFNVDASIGVARDVAGRVVSIAGTIPESMEEGALTHTGASIGISHFAEEVTANSLNLRYIGRTALVQREPYGVVLAIAPW